MIDGSQKKLDIELSEAGGEQSQLPALARSAVPILSPLRYPGSKRRFANYIQLAIGQNQLRPELYVEVFAGGASVALQLLSNNIVAKAGLIDIDPLVAAFWRTLFWDTDWLVEQVDTIQVTLEQWYAFKSELPKDCRTRALACMFLNRTSFSGILAPCVGPIGGKEQKSDYPIDCRFPRETLKKRIRQASLLKDRILFVMEDSWENSLRHIKDQQQVNKLPKNTFYYFDPPFFKKADKLYTHFFTESQHKQLRDAIVSMQDDWLLSYDSPEDVTRLYGQDAHNSVQVELLYSTAQTPGSRTAHEVILSNLKHLPTECRLWRKSKEWHNKNLENCALPLTSNLDIQSAMESRHE